MMDTTNPTLYLSQDDLLDLHAYIVTTYGGLLGIASQDRLTTVLNAPRQAMFGAELYPDLCSKASVLTFLIIKDHPFLSGNDGTALIAMLRFLESNGHTLRADIGSAELVWLVRALAHSDMNREGLEAWLRENVVSTNPPTTLQAE
jgi:death-on-curing protein